MSGGTVDADHGTGLGEAVTLVHGDANGIEESLQLNVQQCPAADEEFHISAKGLSHFAEDNHIEKGIYGPEQCSESSPPVPANPVIPVGDF